MASVIPQASLDLSSVEVSQDVAERSILIYGAPDDFDSKNIKGNVSEVSKKGDAVVVIFSTPKEASKAVKKYHGKNGMVVCKDFAPPILVTGHKPDLFFLRDVPDEISIQDLWLTLDGDEIQLTHISVLTTSSRHVMLCCKEHESLLSKNGTRLKNWRIKVELWNDLCFLMTHKNVVLVENLPEDSTVDTVKQLLGVRDGIKYLEVVTSHNCALVYCQSKPIIDLVVNCNESTLKFSLYKQVACFKNVVFTGNLHETTKDLDLIKHFKDCEITKVIVRLDSRTGLKRASIYLKDEENFKKAVKMNGTELLGQTISVESKPVNNVVERNRVFITDLHRGTTKLHVCLTFQDCGHIIDVFIPKQKNIVNFKEAAYIEFRDSEAIGKALGKSGMKLRGMRFNVHADDPYEGRKKRKRSGVKHQPKRLKET